jgi:hypothetical protein
MCSSCRTTVVGCDGSGMTRPSASDIAAAGLRRSLCDEGGTAEQPRAIQLHESAQRRYVAHGGEADRVDVGGVHGAPLAWGRTSGCDGARRVRARQAGWLPRHARRPTDRWRKADGRPAARLLTRSAASNTLPVRAQACACRTSENRCGGVSGSDSPLTRIGGPDEQARQARAEAGGAEDDHRHGPEDARARGGIPTSLRTVPTRNGHAAG